MVMLTTYVTNLIPKLVEDATSLMPDGFIFLHDGALAHRSFVTNLIQFFLTFCRL